MSLVLKPDGPGTTVNVLDASQGLPSAPRGTAAVVGRFSSGPVDKAALALTPLLARLISGEPDDSFIASLVLDDVYSFAAPPALIARVTDGNEYQSRLDLWDRRPQRSYSKTSGGSSGGVNVDRAPMATALANNGGRWGGRRRVLVGDLATPATDITSTTVDLSTAAEVPASMLENVLADALLYLEGDAESPYTIVSNTTAGIATIKGRFSQAALDADGTGVINGEFAVVLEDDKELTVVIGPDSTVGSRFSLAALRKFSVTSDWEVVSSYDHLGLDEDSGRPWTTVIADGETERYQIAVSSTYTGATVEEFLPCNFSEVPLSVSGPILAFQWYRWARSLTSAGNGYLSTIAALDSTQIVPHVYTVTWSSATTFSVVVTYPDGTTQTLTAAGTTGTLYNPSHPQLTSFTVIAGGTPFAANDAMTIRVNALPLDLYKRNAYIYPVAVSADGTPTQRLKIVSNTYNTVTVRSDLDLADYDSEVGAPASVTGSVDLTAVSLVAATTVILTPDGGTSVTLTVIGTPGPGAAAIAVALTALDTAGKFTFTATTDGHLKVSVAGSYGSQSKLVVGNGTADGALGLVNGTSAFGTDAIPFRLEARWPMWGGYDGSAPADADYIQALDQNDSVFKCHLNRNLGLVRMTTPDVTSVAVKQAAEALVSANGWYYIAEFAASIEALSSPGEGAVDDMTSHEAESDYVEHYFPSRCKFLNTSKTRLVTRSNSGVVLGLHAKMASEGVDGEKGFHIAIANNNPQGRFSPLVKGLPDSIGRWSPPIKFMTDHGITPLLWEGPDVYAFGNRLYSRGRTEKGARYTVTERAVLYHIARDLFVTTRPFIFKTISARRLGDVQVALRDKMKAYFLDGWFSDFGGALPGFEQQVSVQVPLSDNPPEALLEGRVSATIKFRPRSSLEDLQITLSPLQTEAA